MASSLSRAMKLFGTEEPVPETPVLRAGPLECSLDAGNLRHIRLHGVEAIRAVSYIVRDRNWGTYNPEITNLQIEQDAAGFRVTLRRGLPRRAAGLRLPRAHRRPTPRAISASRPRARRSPTSSPTAPASSSCTRWRASAVRRSRSSISTAASSTAASPS